ncbi:hypothetical protein E2C01_058711 [Portunus trituberculatus]|uniref:Uncharacterized protein n=1 Tax=Portunus trituberculatus TaxID=210409 RepID=A0A5B7H3G2_PORTR|nr:hypothetical protein [Portunus trituberculatus]
MVKICPSISISTSTSLHLPPELPRNISLHLHLHLHAPPPSASTFQLNHRCCISPARFQFFIGGEYTVARQKRMFG